MLAATIPLISTLVFATSVRAAASTVSVYNGWLSSGCFEDSINARVLPNQRYPAGGPAAMTVEGCLDACRADGFSVGGLEWGQECWCGNTTPSTSANDCDMACKGNSDELCGGGNRISVYQYGNLATYNDWTFDNCYTDSIWNRVLPNQLSVSGGMTVEKCLDACDAAGYAFGGVEWGKECWGGNVSPSDVAQDQRCNLHCEGNNSELCGGGNGLSVYHSKNPKGPTNLASYKDWTYDNCFTDSRWNRVLPQQLSVSGQMTIEKCLDACDAAGYPYAGLEWSQECFCGRSEPAEIATDGRCNLACKGNGDELCGGGNGLSVYHSSAQAPHHLDSYDGWSYEGCFVDSIDHRVLPVRACHEHDGDMTIEICLDECKKEGFRFAGVEYGSECWCGNWKPWNEADDGRCDMPCVGNPHELCGGGNGIDVYEHCEPRSTTVVTAFTTTTAVVETLTIATTIATPVTGTGSYAQPITTTTAIVVPATITTTILSPLTITTTAIIPYITTTTQIGEVTLTSTLETTLVGSTTVVVPIVGSTTEAIPLTGSTTVAVPLTGSTTTFFPVTTSTTVFAPSTGTRTVPITVGRTSFTLSIYTGTTSFIDPITTIYQPVIILTTLAKTYTTTTGSPQAFTTSVPSVQPLTLTGTDIDFFTTTSSAIFAVPTTSFEIDTFPAVSSDIEGVTTTSKYFVPFTSETTGFIPVETSSLDIGAYTSTSSTVAEVPTSTTVITEYTTTSIGYTPYTTTAFNAQVTTLVTTVAEPITVTTSFVTRVRDHPY